MLQVRREVSTGQLCGMDPLACGAERDRRAVSRQQRRSQDWLEARRCDVGAVAGRDVRGDRVGLLAGDAALLEREVGGVADGVYVGEAVDATIRIDRDEPV